MKTNTLSKQFPKPYQNQGFKWHKTKKEKLPLTGIILNFCF